MAAEGPPFDLDLVIVVLGLLALGVLVIENKGENKRGHSQQNKGDIRNSLVARIPFTSAIGPSIYSEWNYRSGGLETSLLVSMWNGATLNSGR